MALLEAMLLARKCDLVRRGTVTRRALLLPAQASHPVLLHSLPPHCHAHTCRDHGCHGGLMDFAFDFILQNGGLDTEKDYK